MRSSSCLSARDWNFTKPPYWMNEGGLGLKASARVSEEPETFRILARFPVSGFRQARKAKKETFFSRGFGLQRNTEKSCLTREIHLVPGEETSPSKK